MRTRLGHPWCGEHPGHHVVCRADTFADPAPTKSSPWQAQADALS
ncbi:hypothetical protein [Paenibacillus dendrobii]|nr:hypothetical protein [Paenibacillus dendrobii]